VELGEKSGEGGAGGEEGRKDLTVKGD